MPVHDVPVHGVPVLGVLIRPVPVRGVPVRDVPVRTVEPALDVVFAAILFQYHRGRPLVNQAVAFARLSR